jgi:hypothetical protein
MPTSCDGTLLDYLAKHMVYLSMLAAAANEIVVVIVVGAVIVAVLILPFAVVALALCCVALLFFCHAGWLLPVALPLSLASLLRIPFLADYCVCRALPWWSGRWQCHVSLTWSGGRQQHLLPK